MNKTGMKSLQIRRLTYAALSLAIALVLPFLTGQIPVLLCGFMCGWPWGLAVGFIAPLLRSVMFGMPVMFPGAVAMAFELAVYGGMAGFLCQKLPKKNSVTYAVLLISMISGRIVWGIVRFVLSGLSGTTFSWAMFLAGAVTNAIPGIVLQLILIPILVIAMERVGLSLNRD